MEEAFTMELNVNVNTLDGNVVNVNAVNVTTVDENEIIAILNAIVNEIENNDDRRICISDDCIDNIIDTKKSETPSNYINTNVINDKTETKIVDEFTLSEVPSTTLMDIIPTAVTPSTEDVPKKDSTLGNTLDASNTENEGSEPTDDLEKTSFLNETVSNIPLNDNNGKEEFVKFTPSKRTPTSKMLDKEKFRFDVYRNENQTGFLTDRPLTWLQALKAYSGLDHISCRWEKKMNKGKNKYSEYKLHVCFKEVKHTTLTLKLATGVLVVKGLSYKLWIDNEFTILKEIAQKLADTCGNKVDTQSAKENIRSENNKVTTSSSQPPPPPPPPPPPREPPPPPKVASTTKPNRQQKQKEIPDEISDEMSNLWDENAKLKTAMLALESELNCKTSNQIELNRVFETTLATLQDKFEQVEKHYDTKLEVFSGEIEKLFIVKIANLRHEMGVKLNKIETAVANPEMSHEERDSLANYTHTQDLTDIQMQIDSLKADLIELDAEGIKLEFVNNREETEKTFKDIDETILNIEKVNKQRLEQFKKIEKELNDMKNRQIPHNTTEHTSPSTSTARQGTRRRNTIIDDNTELLMIWDSNSNHIDFRRLWTINKTKTKRCGNLLEVTNLFNEDIVYNNLKYILINVGVNDIDDNSGVAVFNMIMELLEKIQELYPDVIVILSEITPRTDRKDSEVLICNSLIQEHAKINASLFIARHSNLRHPAGIFHRDPKRDPKHLKESNIGRFAANIKRTLERAYGIDSYSHRNRGENDNQYNESRIHPRYNLY